MISYKAATIKVAIVSPNSQAVGKWLESWKEDLIFATGKKVRKTRAGIYVVELQSIEVEGYDV
jgi:hypothetical protein